MPHQTPLPPSQLPPPLQHAQIPAPFLHSQQVHSPWTMQSSSAPFLQASQSYAPFTIPDVQGQQSFYQPQINANSAQVEPMASTATIQPPCPPPSPMQPPFVHPSLQQQPLLTQPHPSNQMSAINPAPYWYPPERCQPSSTPQLLGPPATPAPSSLLRVDSYRPTPSIAPGRSAKEIHQEDREKSMSKSDRILHKICEVSRQISSMQSDLGAMKDQNRQLHTELTTVKNENRQLRDQIHELHLGQRALATKEEIIEDMVNHVTPVLNDQSQAYTDKVDELRNVFPDLVSEKVELRLQGVLSRSQGATNSSDNHTSAQALPNLINRLSGKIEIVERLVTSLVHLEQLPEALTYVVGLKDSLQRMEQTVKHPESTLPEHSEIPIAASPSSLKASVTAVPSDLVHKLQGAVDALHAARGYFEGGFQQQFRTISLEQTQIKHLLHQFLATYISSIPNQPSFGGPSSGLAALAEVAASRTGDTAIASTTLTALPLTPVSNDSDLARDQDLQVGQQDERSDPRAPIESDVFGPIVSIPPAFKDSDSSPLATRTTIGGKPSPSASSMTIHSSVPKASARVRLNAPFTSSGKDRSSDVRPSSPHTGPSPKRANDPSDRPFTRSMSTNAPRRRTYTYNRPGTSAERPIEISSGSSGASPPAVIQNTGCHDSPLTQNAQLTATFLESVPKLEGASSLEDRQGINKYIESMTKVDSFPSQPKARRQSLKTYGSRSTTTTTFGSQISSTSSIGGSRKRGHSTLAADLHMSNARTKRSMIANQQSQHISLSSSGSKGKQGKRGMIPDEDE
ncbi:hypothetical protein I317_00477 [Kwoniella heveanensis CBS 569]|nr:hypothetical protein I317_00477 [Kwoniella heveanensis CBS 569]